MVSKIWSSIVGWAVEEASTKTAGFSGTPGLTPGIYFFDFPKIDLNSVPPPSPLPPSLGVLRHRLLETELDVDLVVLRGSGAAFGTFGVSFARVDEKLGFGLNKAVGKAVV